MAGVDRSALRQAVIAHGHEQAVNFPSVLESIDNIFRDVDALGLLSLLSSYGLTAIVTDDGVKGMKINGREFHQHHVEMMQALSLRIPAAQSQLQPSSPKQTGDAFDLIMQATDAFFARRFTEIENASKEELALKSIQERLRIQTQVVRNWGHFSQVKEMSDALYKGLDDKFHETIGIGATDLLRVFATIIDKVEREGSERLHMLASVGSQPTAAGMIEAYYEANPFLHGSAEEMFAQLPIVRTDRDAARFVIVNHSDLLVRQIYTFSTAALAETCGLERASLARAFDYLSISDGELASVPAEHCFLDNPVWTRPLIRIDEDQYFSAVPHALFSHIHRVFEALCSRLGLESTLQSTRAKFLETSLCATVKAALPTATLHSNIKWRSGDRQFETDLVAVLDGTALIFEAKSGAVSAPALRGATERAKRHVAELIVAPSEQAQRFGDALLRSSDVAQTSAYEALNLPPGAIEHIIRVAVTLEDFSILASAERQLRDLGWLPENHNLAPTIPIADLDVVGRILDFEPCFVHYLQERERIQKEYDITADELDYLGLYLDTLFNFRAVKERGVDGLLLTGASESIDRYFNSQDAGINNVQRPSARIPKFWKRVLEAIYAKRFDRWLEAAIAILSSASPDELRKFAAEFQTIRKRVPKTWGKAGHKFIGAMIPPQNEATAIALVAFPGIAADRRREFAELASSHCFESPNVARCWVIAFNTDDGPEAPHVLVAAYKRPPDATFNLASSL